jgi:hypothetical protein
MADLITLAEYKVAKNITSTNEDAKITPLIASVSQFIRTYCGRTFTDHYTVDKTELFSILWGETSVQVSESPIVTITSITERLNLTAAYEPVTSYYVDPDTDSIHKIGQDGVTPTSFNTGNGAVKIIYQAGWAECPADLKLAVIDLVTYYIKEEYKPNRSIGATSMQNASQSSIPNSAELPAHIKRVLDLYRVV